MTSYFNLLKYAATGQASPDMTYYDKIRASTLMGGAAQTLTGQPPLSFKSNGKPLISWSMKGNGSQTGTPTPDNPVMPEFVGTKTANLWSFDSSWTNVNTDTKSFFQLSMTLYNGSTNLGEKRLDIKSNGYKYLVSVASESDVTRIQVKHNGSTRDIPIGSIYGNFQAGTQFTISMDVSGQDPTTVGGISVSNIMLNLGSTALPYEPYGWAEKITCAGQTVPVYLGQTQTVRRVKKLVLTGEERWNENTSGTNTFCGAMSLAEANTNYASGFCTHVKYVTTGLSSDSELVGCLNGVIYLRLSRAIANTIDNFKSYLAAQYAAGTPVTVWYALAKAQTAIVNEPLAKIGDYSDELHSTDAGVTIPTVKGSNTLTVDTTLQPSEMTITFKG